MNKTNNVCSKCGEPLHGEFCHKCGHNNCKIFKKQDISWSLNGELYDWQNDAIIGWLFNNCSGIMEVITGAGKTFVALASILFLSKQKELKGKLKVFIVVPTINLIEQWKKELLEKLNVPFSDIAILQGRRSLDYINWDATIFISTVNTARELLPIVNDAFKEEGFKTFLVVDECHRCGSNKNSQIFATGSGYDFKLGLSATPERQSDWGLHTVLVPQIGPIVYEYDYSMAVDDGIIPPFELIRCPIGFTLKEQNEYDSISEKIADLIKMLKMDYWNLEAASGTDFYRVLETISRSDERAEILKLLLNKRRHLSHSAENRKDALFKILNTFKLNNIKPKVLIFHEMIEYADILYSELKNNGYNVGLYHSKLSCHEREYYLESYKNDAIDILVACKALDEGLDVPRTNVGIIVSSTKSERQYIQRLGRVLRKSKGKKYSQIFHIYIPSIDETFQNLGFDNLECVRIYNFNEYISSPNAGY